MKDVILKRCCGNCEWSISPECEEEIMKENHYAEDDPTRPRAGDCCLGWEHDENYFCEHHEYISGLLETYSFYDDKYLGPGYFIVSEYDEHVITFLKLYRTGTYNNYSYGIRVYEFDSIIKDGLRDIIFDIGKSDNVDLYMTLNVFAKALGDKIIWSIDKNSFMSADINKYSTSICFNSNDDNSSFIDIKIDNTMKNRGYKLIAHLYRNMAAITANRANEDALKKVRKIC